MRIIRGRYMVVLITPLPTDREQPVAAQPSSSSSSSSSSERARVERAAASERACGTSASGTFIRCGARAEEVRQSGDVNVMGLEPSYMRSREHFVELCPPEMPDKTSPGLGSLPKWDSPTSAFDAAHEGAPHVHLNNERGAPRRVYVSVDLRSIGALNELDGLWQCEFMVRARWCDPCIAEDTAPFPRTAEAYERLWSPCLEVNNAGRDLLNLYADNTDTAWNLKESRSGLVSESALFQGKVAVEVDLHSFPFDEQILVIDIGTKCLPESRVTLVPDPTEEPLSVNCLNGRNIVQESCGFKLLPEARQTWFEWGQRNVGSKVWSRCTLRIALRRHTFWYKAKVLSVTAIIVLWSLSVFLLNPTDFSDRMGILLTLFLTLIAFMFTVNDRLPRVSYLTAFDYIMTASYALLFLSALETSLVFAIAQRYDEAVAKGIDWVTMAVEGALVLAIPAFARRAGKRGNARVHPKGM